MGCLRRARGGPQAGDHDGVWGVGGVAGLVGGLAEKSWAPKAVPKKGGGVGWWGAAAVF
jgi:hypothetical protein